MQGINLKKATGFIKTAVLIISIVAALVVVAGIFLNYSR